jgi:hypothetical protein
MMLQSKHLKMMMLQAKAFKTLSNHLGHTNASIAMKYLRITNNSEVILQKTTMVRVRNIIKDRLQGKEELMRENYFNRLKLGIKFNMDRMRK